MKRMLIMVASILCASACEPITQPVTPSSAGGVMMPTSSGEVSEPFDAPATLPPASPGPPARGSNELRDATGGVMARVDGDGTVHDATGAIVRRVDSDGEYRDVTGGITGRADSDGGYRDSTGAPVGRLEADGTIRDSTGGTVGRLDSDGTIRDATGQVIERIDGPCDEDCRRDAAAGILLK